MLLSKKDFYCHADQKALGILTMRIKVSVPFWYKPVNIPAHIPIKTNGKRVPHTPLTLNLWLPFQNAPWVNPFLLWTPNFKAKHLKADADDFLLLMITFVAKHICWPLTQQFKRILLLLHGTADVKQNVSAKLLTVEWAFNGMFSTPSLSFNSGGVFCLKLDWYYCFMFAFKECRRLLPRDSVRWPG